MSSGGGYVDVTSKPVTPLFSQIKRFRAKVESGDPPLGPLISSPDARVTDAIGDVRGGAERLARLLPACCPLTDAPVVDHVCSPPTSFGSTMSTLR
jgi:hypothetical protein